MKYNELHRLLKVNNWEKLRQNGSHIIYRHPQKSIQITVPNHGSKEIPKGLLMSILKETGIKI